jgi:hypothetical protein
MMRDRKFIDSLITLDTLTGSGRFLFVRRMTKGRTRAHMYLNLWCSGHLEVWVVSRLVKIWDPAASA